MNVDVAEGVGCDPYHEDEAFNSAVRLGFTGDAWSRLPPRQRLRKRESFSHMYGDDNEYPEDREKREQELQQEFDNDAMNEEVGIEKSILLVACNKDSNFFTSDESSVCNFPDGVLGDRQKDLVLVPSQWHRLLWLFRQWPFYYLFSSGHLAWMVDADSAVDGRGYCCKCKCITSCSRLNVSAKLSLRTRDLFVLRMSFLICGRRDG